MLHTAQNLLLAASLALIAAAVDARPPAGPEAVLPASLPEPVQEPERRAPFPVSAGGVDYTVKPL